MEARTWVCIGAALLLLISAYLYWRTIWFFRNPSTWILKKIGCRKVFPSPCFCINWPRNGA